MTEAADTLTLLVAAVEGPACSGKADREAAELATARLGQQVSVTAAAHAGAGPVQQDEGHNLVIGFTCATDAIARHLDTQRAARKGS